MFCSDRLEHLYDEIEYNGIDVVDYHFSDTKKASCMYEVDCFKVIALDRSAIKNTAEEHVILSGELSHYETGSLYLLDATYNMPIYKSNVIKCEGTAKHNTIKKLLPFDEMRGAMQNGYTEVWQLAELFGVTEDFVHKAVTYYTEIRGLDFNNPL